MKLLEKILPKNNPKIEINHILADEHNFVATNSSILIVKKHNMEHIFKDKKYLIINPKANHEIRIDGIEAQMPVNTTQASSYSDYNRVIPSEDKCYDLGKADGINFMYRFTYKCNWIFDYVANASFMKELDKIQLEWYQFRGPKLPVAVGNDEYTIVIMPMVYTDIMSDTK